MLRTATDGAGNDLGGGYRAAEGGGGKLHVDPRTAEKIETDAAKDATIATQAAEIEKLKAQEARRARVQAKWDARKTERTNKKAAADAAIKAAEDAYKNASVPDKLTALRSGMNMNVPISTYTERLNILRGHLEQGGQLIQKRAWGTSDIPRSKTGKDILSIEDRMIKGEDVTFSEFERYKKARIERLTEVQTAHAKGEVVKPSVFDAGPQSGGTPTTQHVSGPWGTVTALGQKVLDRPSPDTIILPRPQSFLRQHWGKLLTGTVFSLHIAGSFNDLSNPSTFNTSGLVNEFVSDWFKGDAEDKNGNRITLGRWGDYKTRSFTLKDEKSFNQLAADTRNGRADPALAYYATDFQRQPGRIATAEGDAEAQSRDKQYQTATERNARAASADALSSAGHHFAPFAPKDP